MLGTLLHEAAHALATARRVHDTSNRGWQDTSLTPTTEATYTEQLNQLAQVLTVYRRAEQPRATAGSSNRNRIPAICACPDPVRAWAAHSTLAEQRLICRDCNQTLRPQRPTDAK